ncbi:HD domain-containing protein [Chitinophaga sancti]|uniref:HD domain-containing protein n=1 Tax=Chitinophaga sancti TaxID=1004 RepID=UPI003F796A7F
MKSHPLFYVWESLVSNYTNDSLLVQEGFNSILTHYNESHRFYHNLDHVQTLLVFIEEYNHLVHDLETLQLAVFFHDIIYDVQRADNEERSALVATQFLEQTSYPPEKIALVSEYIRATKSHQNPNKDSDLDCFLDFDLFILSGPERMYQAYAKNIRKEYGIYPDSVYVPGRKKILQYFLDRPSIYKTAGFRERFDAVAKENIQRELEKLSL